MRSRWRAQIEGPSKGNQVTFFVSYPLVFEKMTGSTWWTEVVRGRLEKKEGGWPVIVTPVRRPLVSKMRGILPTAMEPLQIPRLARECLQPRAVRRSRL